MKRILSTVLLVCVLATCLFAFASCGQHPLQMVKSNLQNGNYTLGTEEMNMKVDGNKYEVAVDMFGVKTTMYLEVADDTVYMYTPKVVSEGYTKTEISADEAGDYTEVFDEERMEKLFNPDNFTEQDDGTYVLNTGIEIDGATDVKIKVVDDDCTITVAGVSMTISDMGNTTVTLPEVE